jgi:Zn-dependent protease with chaperone function
MIATRMGPRRVRLATLTVLAGVWAAAAFFLWDSTRVPDGLHIHGLHAGDFFSERLLRKGDHYETFLRVDALLATAATIIVFVFYARFGNRFMRESAAGPIGTGMLLAMLGFALVWLVRLPFQIAALWWDRRYGVTHASYWELIFGAWLALGASFVFLCAAVLVVMGFARLIGDRWWVPGAACFVGLYAFFVFISPYLVGSSHALSDPQLQADFDRLARREGVGGIPVRVQDVHGETSAANAFAVGFGPTRKVFIWDTLLDGRFSRNEIDFVFAHELGHQARLHLVKAIGWYALFTIPFAFVVARATRGRGGIGQPEAIPLALLVVVVLSTAATPLQAAITRHIEQEADWMALQTTRDPRAGQKLFQHFGKTSLSDPDPPTWAYLWFDDHPTLMQRIAITRAWARRHGVEGAPRPASRR